jgi:Sec-independent protein translocase protein TatA
VTTDEDLSSVASQLADLTRTVDAMARDLKSMTERADRQQARADSQQELVDSQQERAQLQQERIDRAARASDAVIVCKPRRRHSENRSDRS